MAVSVSLQKKGMASAAALLLGLAVSADVPAQDGGAIRYQATKQSLAKHPLPRWYDDAKLGVFIHWGLWSIPGYAPEVHSLEEAVRRDPANAMLHSPWSDDYENMIRVPDSPAAKFHKQNYGSMPYDGFKELFEQNLKNWDPDEWAQIFADSGAKYVVLTANYYDGFQLWPSKVPNRHKPDFMTTRDVTGELAAAVRKRGMRFGILYSGGLNSTFQPPGFHYRTIGGYRYATPCSREFVDYAHAQIRELVERYDIDVLWSDGAWPADNATTYQLLADYYNAVPEGVVNDRFKQSARCANQKLTVADADRDVQENLQKYGRPSPPRPTSVAENTEHHFDFANTEYWQFGTIQKKKWEADRALGYAWGYHRDERFGHGYDSFETIFTEFIDAVSKNGNLLFNVGPTGDTMEIPMEQHSVLRALGHWLRVNGAAVYGTRPWTQAEAVTDTGLQVRFTSKGGAVNAIVLGKPEGTTLTLKNVKLSGTARLLVDGSAVNLRQAGNDTVLTFSTRLNGHYSPAISIGQAR